MSETTICANAIIRHLGTPQGKRRYNAALQAGARDYGALCCVARDAVPYLDYEGMCDVAAEAQRIRNGRTKSARDAMGAGNAMTCRA